MRIALVVGSISVALAMTVGAHAGDPFKPADGRYTGHYTTPNHGRVGLAIDVGGYLRPNHQLPAVRLVRWSGKLRCPGHETRIESTKMNAAIADRGFSGLVMAPGTRLNFEGKFTARDAMRGTIRVKRGGCDTGLVKFVARRSG